MHRDTDNVQGKSIRVHFLSPMEAISCNILQILSKNARFENWGISLGYSPVLAAACLDTGTRLDQIKHKRKFFMDYNIFEAVANLFCNIFCSQFTFNICGD